MRIGVMGAGSIGCYLGGWLAHAGHEVTLVGRAWLGESLAAEGLTLSRYGGEGAQLRLGGNLRFTTDPGDLSGSDVVLVTVKSRDTAGAGQALEPIVPAGVLVVSFQNGLHNAAVLREALPGRAVVAGMVPFNVVRQPPARFHQGTSGPLVIGTSPLSEPFAGAVRGASLPIVVHSDMPGILWSKLLFNLNNATNALCGLPLREQLSDPAFRRLLAATITEGLAVLDKAGIKPRRAGRMMPRLAPRILPLPNWLFFRVASAMIQIDPEARSSMWEDLQRGRPTEVDDLNGKIVAKGAEVGVPTPISSRLIALIRDAEAAGDGSPGLSAAEIWPG